MKGNGSAVDRFAGWQFFLQSGSWGFAALHPRLYAVGCSADWESDVKL